ncbi:MAG TPA: cell division ATP-binding protein FtsE [Abditibacteriaceae bacterium]
MIEFQDVEVRYRTGRGRDVQAVAGVTLRINPGEWVFFVGATGAGKSTLLRLVYAGAQATKGKVIVDGRDVTNLPQHQIPWLRRKLGVVFQDFQLLEQKTVWENVAFALQVTGTPRHKLSSAVAQALDTVGLSHRAGSRPRELSGGEQQRAAIARAIVNEPLILLADEPTGNLDPATGHEIAEVLQRVHERGTTVLMATHDRALVDAMRRRVVRFANGKLVSDDLQGVYQIDEEPRGLSAQKGDALMRALLDKEDKDDAERESHREALLAESYEEPATESEEVAELTEAESVINPVSTESNEVVVSEVVLQADQVNQPEPTPQPIKIDGEVRQVDTRPWIGRSEVRSSLKNTAPLGTAENPLVVGVENEEL